MMLKVLSSSDFSMIYCFWLSVFCGFQSVSWLYINKWILFRVKSMLQAHPSICQQDIKVTEHGLSAWFWELCRSDFSQAKSELEESTLDWGGWSPSAPSQQFTQEDSQKSSQKLLYSSFGKILYKRQSVVNPYLGLYPIPAGVSNFFHLCLLWCLCLHLYIFWNFWQYLFELFCL